VSLRRTLDPSLDVVFKMLLTRGTHRAGRIAQG
jgi:hypothetical protein